MKKEQVVEKLMEIECLKNKMFNYVNYKWDLKASQNEEEQKVLKEKIWANRNGIHSMIEMAKELNIIETEKSSMMIRKWLEEKTSEMMYAIYLNGLGE